MANPGHVMPGGRFPIDNRSDLEKAITASGRAKGGDAGRKAVRKFIMKRAKDLSLTDMIPSHWMSDGSLQQ